MRKRVLLFIALLTACAEDTTPRIGEKVPVHEYYSAVVHTYEVKEQVTCENKDGSMAGFEKNGYQYVVIGMTVSGNTSDKANHVLDSDDFKLADSRTISSKHRSPIQDYAWIGRRIGTSSEEKIILSFEVPASLISSYGYLEIDFEMSIGNASYVRLESREQSAN